MKSLCNHYVSECVCNVPTCVCVQILSDSEKRRNYDVTGRVGDPPHQSSGFPQGHGFTFTQGGFRFFFPSGSTQRSDGINTAQFYDEVLVQSHHKPYLLNFYTDFCMQCADVEVIWKALHKVHYTMCTLYVLSSHTVLLHAKARQITVWLLRVEINYLGSL